ncbi:MAG: DUF3362 domain-containing protein, partial [Candidatus Sedimenticola sp. (ex Thyasira tokunagai)]
LRYHDAENWPLLREALKAMGRADLIGNGKRHLVPAWQPAGTAKEYNEKGATAKPAKRHVKRGGRKTGKLGKRQAKRKPSRHR